VTPIYQWFNNAGTVIGTQATLTLNPLMESYTGEYSCMITDQSDGLVGCGVHRVSVQGILGTGRVCTYEIIVHLWVFYKWANIILFISI
jgi:hypothetical protein